MRRHDSYSSSSRKASAARWEPIDRVSAHRMVYGEVAAAVTASSVVRGGSGSRPGYNRFGIPRLRRMSASTARSGMNRRSGMSRCAIAATR